uniref:Uncharacterized protein n=1 Tax=Aureoumbra lagunensis TaxID=44058 RepID=A0A7S3NMK3_9STRA|mmetsp:Transcript_20832/g.31905  ORF Transcript_20832/g.31905 Transcript_20832/m.31905 type:complete len:566 (+) Transcript_20832:26-1723(+)
MEDCQSDEEEEDTRNNEDTKRLIADLNDVHAKQNESSLKLLQAVEGWRLLTIFGIVCIWYGVIVVWELKARPFWFLEVSATRRGVLDMIINAPWGLRLVASECGLVGHSALLASDTAAFFAFIVAGQKKDLHQLEKASVLAIIQGATMLHLVTVNKIVSEAVRASNDPRALTSIFWIIGKPFELTTLALSGSLLEWTPVRISYMPGLTIASLLAAIVIGFGQNLHSRSTRYVQQQNIANHKKKIFLGLGFILGLASSCIAALALFPNFYQWQRLLIATIAVVLCGLTPLYLVLESELAAIGAFFILRACCTLDVRGATFLYYTEPLPGFPQLDEFFMSTILGYVAEICALAGILIYKNYLKKWETRKVFQLVAALTCLSNLSAIPLIYWRLFASYPFFDRLAIIIEEAISVIVLNVNDVPLTLLVSTRCQPGNDATVFALLGSTRHFANQFAPFAGNLILSLLGANPKDKPGDRADVDALNRLWIAKFIVALTVLLPAFSPIIRLIPENDIGGTATSVTRADNTSSHRHNSTSVCSVEEEEETAATSSTGTSIGMIAVARGNINK